jgi:hypothetical protein
LPPNTLAKRLFSEVVRKQDPDLLILSIENFQQLSLPTPIALGGFLRSSLLLIESLIPHSVQSSISRLIRETSSVNPIAIVLTQPTQPTQQTQPRCSARERKLADLSPGIVKYPAKGLIVLDGSFINCN